VYTIKEASARSGVGAPLIRAWERRYGVVEPVRTAAGYRLYDDNTIRILQTMRSLTESGWTASEAARAISAGEVAVDASVPVLDGPSAAATHRARLIERFIAAAESTSPSETEAALDEILGAGSFESIVDDVLLPAAATLGDSWQAGRLSVAGEHAASAAVARRLATLYQAAGTPGRAAVVVGMPPDARHELGALAFAAALRRRGVGVLYLGADVPVDSWLAVVTRTRARASVVGVVTSDDRAAAADVVAMLQTIPGHVIAVGGAAAGTDLSRIDGIIVLPRRVVEAAHVIAEVVGRRR
jgi:DNA-binding transcriptional MerR regulator